MNYKKQYQLKFIIYKEYKINIFGEGIKMKLIRYILNWDISPLKGICGMEQEKHSPIVLLIVMKALICAFVGMEHMELGIILLIMLVIVRVLPMSQRNLMGQEGYSLPEFR